MESLQNNGITLKVYTKSCNASNRRQKMKHQTLLYIRNKISSTHPQIGMGRAPSDRQLRKRKLTSQKEWRHSKEQQKGGKYIADNDSNKV